MGKEVVHGADDRLFPYRVDARLMGLAKADAIFMHCLPAHRGEEITDEVLDGPRCLAYDQAENRLHSQKAIMERVMLA